MNHNEFLSDSILRTAFFTGHRYLPEEVRSRISSGIYQCISEAYSAGYRRFFCGCALGFDTLAAFQTVRLREQYPDVILSLAVPCLSQADKWQEKDRIVYRKILDLADEKTILSPAYYKGIMLTRNRYMADRSSLCICYLTHFRSGTASTVRYAVLQDRIRIINIAAGISDYKDQLRERTWNYIYIYHSAKKNAGIAHLHLLQAGNLTMRHT